MNFHTFGIRVKFEKKITKRRRGIAMSLMYTVDIYAQGLNRVTDIHLEMESAVKIERKRLII